MFAQLMVEQNIPGWSTHLVEIVKYFKGGRGHTSVVVSDKKLVTNWCWYDNVNQTGVLIPPKLHPTNLANLTFWGGPQVTNLGAYLSGGNTMRERLGV